MTPITADHPEHVATPTMSLPEQYYFAADDRCTDLLVGKIPFARNSAARAELLQLLAAEQSYLAALHVIASRPQLARAVMLDQAARLVQLIAAAELARAEDRAYTRIDDDFEERDGVLDTLTELAAAENIGDRAQILVILHELIAPYTAGDAAEIIISVAEAFAERWGGISR